MDGIECVAKLNGQMPNLQILMLTRYEQNDLIFNSIRAGVSGQRGEVMGQHPYSCGVRVHLQCPRILEWAIRDMAQIFRKSSNSFARATVAIVFFGFFGFWGVVYAMFRSPYTTDVNIPRVQEVPFSHQHHVSGLGIDCRYCHTSVEKSSFAGIPPTHTCMTCHSQLWTEAPMLAPVRNSLATGQPLTWTRVNQTPDFVFFNHSIHVQKGIGCSTCHGRVDQMPLTWKAHSLYMRWCLDCHEAPEKHLRPQAEIFDMAWREPKDQLKQGQELMKRYHITRERLDQLRDCSMCHR